MNQTFVANISVEVFQNKDGTFDAYIATDSSSGENYNHVSADEIGEHVAGLIECIVDE